MSRLRSVSVFAVAMTTAVVAFPCGDKLSALAGGVRFERIHAARHPGRVIIFAPNDSPLRAANTQLQLAEVLRRAGHAVNVVDEQQQLQRAMQLANADLILVDVSDAGRFESFERSSAPAALLTVSYAAGPSAQNVTAGASKCVTRLTKRSNPLLLRSIDDLLERRSKGKIAACDTSLPRAT